MTEQPPNPPSGEPTDPYGFGPSADAAGDAPAYPYGEGDVVGTAPPKPNRRGLVIGASAAVLALVAGAAVWATATLSGGGRQPDDVVPDTTFAYVKIDLDPAANQKLAARTFFGRFPQLKDKVANADTMFDNLLAEVIDDEDFTYRDDVQPWFDKRAGVAVFPSAGGPPHVVGALRSKDDAKARASLDKAVAEAKQEGETIAYRLVDGYAIIGTKESVDAAAQATAKGTLADNKTYQNDIDRLSGDQIAAGWVDTEKVLGVVRREIPEFALLPGIVTDQFKGRVVAGLHFTGDYVELEGLTIGITAAGLDSKPDMSLLTGLPADTSAALSISGLGTALEAQAGLLEQAIGGYLQGSGISFADDLLPLLRDRVVVSAGNEELDAPEIGITAKVADPAQAKRSGDKIAAIIEALGVPATVAVEGDTFVLATPQRYAGELVTNDGGLGAAPGFTKAMGDLAGVSNALYLNVDEMRKVARGLFDEVPTGLHFGAVSGVSGSDGFFRVRFVAG